MRLVKHVPKDLGQLIISFLFLTAISLPGFIWAMSSTKDISEKEARRLAKAPQIKFDETLLNTFPKKFDRYFDDHYGLRTELVAINQLLRTKVFNKSFIRRGIRGKDNWLFLDLRDSLHDHVGLKTLTEIELNEWQQHLIDKKYWLNSLGIQYLFVPVPNKMSIYPEYLPARISNYSGTTMLNQLEEALKTNPDFNDYIFLEKLLTGLKISGPRSLQNLLETSDEVEQLYFKMDSHWTSIGGFLSYRHILQKLQTILPGLQPAISLAEMRPDFSPKKSDIARMLSMTVTETHHLLKPKKPCSSNKFSTVTSFNQTEAYALKKKRSPRARLPTKAGCKDRLFKAVISKDSFGNRVKPFFAESFKEVVFMDHYDLVGLESFLREFKPDVFIDLRSERMVQSLLEPDERLHNAVTAIKQAKAAGL